MKITLTKNEQMICLMASIKITSQHGDLSETDRDFLHANTYDYLVNHAESVGSEWAVAKYLGLPYDPFTCNLKSKADVGNGIEVKWTKYDQGQLIVHEYDRQQDIAILVTGQSPTYRIAGWIPIAMAQKPRYKHSKQPNWWVTQINLQPIENLRKSNYATAAI